MDKNQKADSEQRHDALKYEAAGGLSRKYGTLSVSLAFNIWIGPQSPASSL